MDDARGSADGKGKVSPSTRYEWHATAVRDGETVTDVRGICRYYTTAARHVEAELAGAPADADAYGSVRGLTVTFTYANAANGGYQRWDRQAVAVRGPEGISWFRDREVDGDSDCLGSGRREGTGAEEATVATSQKKETISPIGLVVLFLAFALAAGGIGNIGGGDGGGGGSTSDDPCEDKPPTHVIETWHTLRGTFELKCGDAHEGWEHLKARGRTRGKLDDVLDCIGDALRHASEPKLLTDSRTIGPRHLYRWKWGNADEVAKVWVLRETGSVLSATPGKGNQAALWARCAGR